MNLPRCPQTQDTHLPDFWVLALKARVTTPGSFAAWVTIPWVTNSIKHAMFMLTTLHLINTVSFLAFFLLFFFRQDFTLESGLVLSSRSYCLCLSSARNNRHEPPCLAFLSGLENSFEFQVQVSCRHDMQICKIFTIGACLFFLFFLICLFLVFKMSLSCPVA